MATIHSTPAGGGAVSFPLVPDADQTEEVGQDGTRFLGMHSRLGAFVGTSTSAGAVSTGPNPTFGTNPTGLLAGNMIETSTGAASMTHAGGAFKPVATLANAYTSGAGDAIVNNAGGGSTLAGAAFATGAGDASLQMLGYGCFQATYAYTTGGGNHVWTSRGLGNFMGGFSGGTGTVGVSFNVGTQGAFFSGAPRSNNATATMNVTFTATADGAFAQGRMIGSTAATTNTWSISGVGSFTQGNSLNSNFTNSGAGAFLQAQANGADVICSAVAAFAHGYARNSNDLTASGIASLAIGDTNNGAITASATNAFQFGVGTNSTADSLQVGNDFVAKANGQHGGANDNLTLGAAATTFAATSTVMTITGDAGANTIATITGGVDGQLLTLIFVDANVTITDDNTHATNSVDLSASFTSADDTVLQLVFDGTSWYETARSAN